MEGRPKIAVVAMQGDYEKHIEVLTAIGADAFPARLPEDMESADGVILPGGESTTIGKMLARYGVDDAIRQAASAGTPIYGTCAGLILLAREIVEETQERGGQATLGLLDIKVARNAFGRQIDSFEAELDAPAVSPEPFHAVFIRAPYVVSTGDGVETLASHNGRIVLVQQGCILGSAFHPEIAGEQRLHRYFLSLITKERHS